MRRRARSKVMAFAPCVLLATLAVCAPAGAVVPGQNDRLAWAKAVSGAPERSQIVTIPCIAPGCTPAPITSGATLDDEPAWNPVLPQIAFQRAPVCEEAFCAEIWLMGSDGANQQPLTTNDGGTTASGAPSWAPDGEQIAFWTNRAGADQIWLMKADGSNEHPLTSGPCDLKPDWSPGRDKIAFQSCRDGGEEIYVINADGTGETRLTDNAFPDGSPAWSPDGQKIAFSSNRNGNRDLYTMNPDGTGETRITTDPAPDDAPAWSPDGTRIAFTSARGPGVSGEGIYYMRPDGTDQHLYGGSNTENETAPNWGRTLPPGYARPRGATPLHASLVLAYEGCALPNRTHGPPLAFGSCNPAQPTSPNLTVGTADANGRPAKYVGSIRYDVIVGNPSTPENEADVHVEVRQSDVRWKSDLTDYAGQMWAETTWRITDAFNDASAGGGTDRATTIDIPITTAIFACAETADPGVGANCGIDTAFNAIVPGAIQERRRTIVQLGQVQMYDGGPDGVAGTSPDSVFARQGLFIP